MSVIETRAYQLFPVLDPGQIETAKRFASAQAADLGRKGAGAFHRQLVKSDLASDYVTDLRTWLEELV